MIHILCNTVLHAKIVYVRVTDKVNSALHPSGVAKSSTSFGWSKGGKVTSAGWQVTLCDLIWHVISRSGVVISITNCYIRFTLLYFTLMLFTIVVITLVMSAYLSYLDCVPCHVCNIGIPSCTTGTNYTHVCVTCFFTVLLTFDVKLTKECHS